MKHYLQVLRRENQKEENQMEISVILFLCACCAAGGFLQGRIYEERVNRRNRRSQFRKDFK